MPTYERDNGPLSPEALETIRKLVPQNAPFTATKTLFNQSTRKGEILAEAVHNASIFLGITSDELNNILGYALPQSTQYIKPENHIPDLAIQFIRIYKCLFWHMGGIKEEMRHWLHTPNSYFDNRVPLELMQTPEGLDSVLVYLDGMMNKH